MANQSGSLGRRREQKSNVALLADRIVALLSEGSASSFVRANEALASFFNGDLKLIGKAYEVACMVVMKRQQDQIEGSKGVERVTPLADWMALCASREAAEGRLADAFLHLREAVRAGARKAICKKVVTHLLRQLPEEDRLLVLIYGRKGLVGLEIGRVRGRGLIILSGNEQSFLDCRLLREQSGNSEKCFLRDAAELLEDQKADRLKSKLLSESPLTLESLDWNGYYRELCREDLVRQKSAA